MRPGRFHPGNEKRSRLLSVTTTSFNEAGAFPPRKYLKTVEAVTFYFLLQ